MTNYHKRTRYKNHLTELGKLETTRHLNMYVLYLLSLFIRYSSFNTIDNGIQKLKKNANLARVFMLMQL